MESQVLRLVEIASLLRFSTKYLQNKINVDPRNPARGVIELAHARIDMVRVGRVWLARRQDVEMAVFGAAPADARIQ